jgi:hypothetical protein
MVVLGVAEVLIQLLVQILAPAVQAILQQQRQAKGAMVEIQVQQLLITVAVVAVALLLLEKMGLEVKAVMAVPVLHLPYLDRQ